MKHAYLILAHGGWELLQTLIFTLDDERNSIFVHMDAKAGPLPHLIARNASLRILDRRLDVRWGDVSVVEAEYLLFQEAVSKGPFAYYHLLSGTDLPIKTQDQIHEFFDANAGKEFIGYTSTRMTPELVRKVCRRHLFPGSFRRKNAVRAAFLRLQELLGVRRNSSIAFKKGSQWVSITDAAARIFLEGYPSMRKAFSHTFCADEIALHTIIWDSPLRANIYSLQSDSEGCLRAIGWRNGCLYDWADEDFETLRTSGAMFARKFNLSDRAFIRKVIGLSVPSEKMAAGPAVSVIMPVFNASATLGKSLASLSEQRMKDFEVIFVDDCSTDSTPSILENFSRTSGIPCTIIRLECNSGVAAARNIGLDAAKGEYIAWLDADDAFTPGTLQKALDAASPLVSGVPVDIMGYDWNLVFESSSRYMRQASWATPSDALKALCGGTSRWNLWLFLLRREFVRSSGLRFCPGANMGEDMAFMISAFASAKMVIQIHEPLYLYNAANEGSISRRLSTQRRKEIETNIGVAQTAISSSSCAEPLVPYLDYLKLYLKLPLLVSGSREDFELWQSWLKEANPKAASNRALPLRTRLLQWMAGKNLWAGVRIYYIFVYKLVYGVIFR